jgi:hypothetical protein
MDGAHNLLGVLTKKTFLARTVFEPRTFQPENWGILEDKTASTAHNKQQAQPTTNSKHSPQQTASTAHNKQ